MIWDDVRIFLAIADQGSLAGAARQLRVNHSTDLPGFFGPVITELRLPVGWWVKVWP